MPARSRSLHHALRRFCLGAFALLSRDVESGTELPFAFEEHRAPGRPPLYEYRPLAREFVEARERSLAALEDTRIALEAIARVPGAALFSRAHADGPPTSELALVRSVLLPLVAKTVERCGGLDWDDLVFERVYEELERSLLAERRAYVAITPLVGASAGVPVDLGGGLRVRHAEPGEVAGHWPEASGLLPAGFGREPDALLLLEWQRSLPSGAGSPDAPGELADAVSALRLATGGPIAAGPVVFERLDWRPLGIRPLLPVAATRPAGELVRLDVIRGRVAHDLLGRLSELEADAELGEAVERWELSLFQAGASRDDSLREALGRALGAADGDFVAALRAALLLGESGARRRELLEELRPLGRREPAGPGAPDAVRRCLIEVLLHGDRQALVASLDESLLGLQPRPAMAVASAAAVS